MTKRFSAIRLYALIAAFGGAWLCQILPALAETVEEHGGAEKGALPQLDASTYPSQLFWLAVTFAVMFVFFSKKTLPEISGVLEKRERHIREDIDTAETLRRQAEDAKTSYEKLMEDSRAESARLLANATDMVKHKAERELENFRARAADDVARLEADLAQVKIDAMNDMHTIVAEVASEAASRIVGIKPDLKQAQTVVKSLQNREAA